MSLTANMDIFLRENKKIKLSSLQKWAFKSICQLLIEKILLSTPGIYLPVSQYYYGISQYFKSCNFGDVETYEGAFNFTPLCQILGPRPQALIPTAPEIIALI